MAGRCAVGLRTAPQAASSSRGSRTAPRRCRSSLEPSAAPGSIRREAERGAASRGAAASLAEGRGVCLKHPDAYELARKGSMELKGELCGYLVLPESLLQLWRVDTHHIPLEGRSQHTAPHPVHRANHMRCWSSAATKCPEQHSIELLRACSTRILCASCINRRRKAQLGNFFDPATCALGSLTVERTPDVAKTFPR